MKELDNLHHFAFHVSNIEQAVDWYLKNFNCNLKAKYNGYALLEFANGYLALTDKYPTHVGIKPTVGKEGLTITGNIVIHRDGSTTFPLKDIDGNKIELVLGEANLQGEI